MKTLKRLWGKIRAYALFIAAALGVGALSALLTRDAMADFEKLAKPPLSPPGWLFPVVWTVLFILMGISMAIVWRSGRSEHRGSAIFYWCAQLFANFFWTLIFFKFEYRLFAFFWLLLLLALVLLMVRSFGKVNRTAEWLQLPYILWLVFAGYLNMGVYLLNR